jgi:hypothetical protein
VLILPSSWGSQLDGDLHQHHAASVVASPSQMSRFLGPFLCGGRNLVPVAGVGRPWQWAAGKAIWRAARAKIRGKSYAPPADGGIWAAARLAQGSILSVFFWRFFFFPGSLFGWFFWFFVFQTILNLHKFKIRIIFEFKYF